MRVLFVRITLGVVLCLGIAGCGDDSPAPKPYSGPSKSASASPSGAPTLPADARGTTEASAKAFVAYYFRVLGYATVSGDVAQLSQLGKSECRSCSQIVDSIQAIYEDGGHAEGRGYSVAKPAVRTADGIYTVTLSIISYPQTVVARASAKGRKTPRSMTDAVFHLIQDDGHWVVRDWTRV